MGKRLEAGNGSETPGGHNTPAFLCRAVRFGGAVIGGVLAGFDLISCRQGFVFFTLMTKRAGRVCHPGLFPASNVYVEGIKIL